MKPKAIGALVVVIFLLSSFTINPLNTVYGSMSEKIFLEQKFTQFPNQVIHGFCYLKMDDDGKIVSMTKIWNAPWAMRELGWM